MRELGQPGAACGGGWGSGRGALGSHGRGRRFKTCHAHQPVIAAQRPPSSALTRLRTYPAPPWGHTGPHGYLRGGLHPLDLGEDLEELLEHLDAWSEAIIAAGSYPKRITGVYNVGGGPHFGSGLTIDTAAEQYENKP